MTSGIREPVPIDLCVQSQSEESNFRLFKLTISFLFYSPTLHPHRLPESRGCAANVKLARTGGTAPLMLNFFQTFFKLWSFFLAFVSLNSNPPLFSHIFPMVPCSGSMLHVYYFSSPPPPPLFPFNSFYVLFSLKFSFHPDGCLF